MIKMRVKQTVSSSCQTMDTMEDYVDIGDATFRLRDTNEKEKSINVEDALNEFLNNSLGVTTEDKLKVLYLLYFTHFNFNWLLIKVKSPRICDSALLIEEEQMRQEAIEEFDFSIKAVYKLVNQPHLLWLAQTLL